MVRAEINESMKPLIYKNKCNYSATQKIMGKFFDFFVFFEIFTGKFLYLLNSYK
ncbi:hypothetical protein MSIBF_A1320006 [groundwater metagenome]|uniref:Uncharacterized protein n=1 Tax=groundwater metagenome TaxID=717931 RepID=A0A098E604_9ZZZZ